jgi:cell division protein FtsQ
MTVRRRPRVRLRIALAVAAALALLAGAWMWVRDSPLVSVRKVTITGVSGPDAGQIRAALTLAARNMTTLDAHVGALRTAVAPYPVVDDLRVATHFPHGMSIHVIEQLPVGALMAGGRTIAASGDGTLLHDLPTSALPVIPVAFLPAGSRVVDQQALGALALLAATPKRLLSRVSQVSTSAPHGLVVALRSGPSIYFGDRSRVAAKWEAATEVLADPSSAGATYIDVSDPDRPAAGVSEQAVVAAGLATSASGDASTGTSPSSAATTPATSTGTAATTPATSTGTAATTPATSTGTAAP